MRLIFRLNMYCAVLDTIKAIKKGIFAIFLWHPNLLLVNREYVRNVSLFFVWLKAESLSEESCKLLWVASCPAFIRCNTHTPLLPGPINHVFYLGSKAKEGKQRGPLCINWGIFFFFSKICLLHQKATLFVCNGWKCSPCYLQLLRPPSQLVAT